MRTNAKPSVKSIKRKLAAEKLTSQPASYVERTDASQHSAMAQTIDSGIKKFDSGITRIVAGANEMVVGVNEVYDAGRDFSDARDLNQFEFRQWHDNAQDWKEDALRREKMNCAIKVYEAMKERGRAKKLSDCPKAVQIIIKFALPPDKEPKKLSNGEDTGGEVEKNWWNKLTSVSSDLETVILRLQDDGERPIEQMLPDELDKLVRATDPIVKINEQAKKMLGIYE